MQLELFPLSEVQKDSKTTATVTKKERTNANRGLL